MTLKSTFQKLRCFTLLTATAALLAANAQADPLPGRNQLKFQQLPLDGLTITDATGITETYFGHDEFSTAYGEVNAVGLPIYRGRFMADDFADRFKTPVVHVKWWGSYLNNIINPDFPVDKFLISFESDIPDPDGDTGPGFSQPGQPLLNQIVKRGPIAPGSGTFTEKPISPGGAPLFEGLYEYNAELHLDKAFPENPDEVYWLKIVALVDVPAGFPPIDPFNPPTNVTQWGWHNRDYSVMDPLASVPPAVVPGERDLGPIPGTNVPVWHFQDDAVTGLVTVDTSLTPDGLVMPEVFQDQFQPTHYVDFWDGPGGFIPGDLGIGRYSKDLAFELYTIVPEPTSCLLMLLGLSCSVVRRTRS